MICVKTAASVSKNAVTAKTAVIAAQKQKISVKIAEKNALIAQKTIFVQIVATFVKIVVAKATGVKTVESALYVQMKFALDVVNVPNVQLYVKAAAKNVRNALTGSVAIANSVRTV